jgi:two-component system, NtrC family, sensor kinase
MEDRRYYQELTRKMAMIMILVSLTPLLLISGIIGHQFETSYREKVVAHLVELVKKHQQAIDMFLKEKLGFIEVLANTFTYDQLNNEAFLAQKLAALKKVYGSAFVDLGLVDDQGVQIAYAGTLKLGQARYSEADWFKKAITRETFISDVFLGLRHQPHFIVSVKRKENGREWLLRATIDFEAFNSLVDSIRIGETGSAFIINREGQFQTLPRVAPPLGEAFLRQFVVRGKDEPGLGKESHSLIEKLGLGVVHQDVADHSVAVGEVEVGDHEYLYVTVPLKSDEWLLTYQQDEADAFKSLYQTRTLAIFFCVGGGLGIIAMAFVLASRMVQHVEHADREQEMMNEQVIEAGRLASVGELAAGIAHEINNPIAIMVEEAGWIGDLLQEEDLKETENVTEFRRALNQIRVQGQRCKEITHKLLSFARRTDPRVREVDLNELVEEVVGVSEQRSRFGNVKISLHLDPALPAVSVSPSEMQQVLLNLINNAIDAIGPGGGDVEITTRVEKENVVVDVKDNGEGIPKAIQARIFDPFFTTKPVGKGTGLGLSICYGIVKKLGGEITVNSAVGVGTTFHIYMPIHSSKASDQPEEKTNGLPAGSSDDSANR